MHVLKLTSRTFYIPIKLLKPKLRKTVGSAYLCMRAIDEIEDHIQLESEIKQHLLRETSQLLKQQPFDKGKYQSLIQPYEKYLPEVTIRLGDWIDFCPDEITGTVTDATSVMANGMAKWVDKGWKVKTEEDLDEYTYYVAGLVGIMLSDIWKWYDGTTTNRELAIGYGRGLQAVNVLRNVDEDRERGVQFFPDSWTKDDMFAYAEENLRKADAYMKDIKTKKTYCYFVKSPSH